MLLPISQGQSIAIPSTGEITRISGTVSGTLIPNVQLRFFRDYISMDEELFRLPLDKEGKFEMRFELEQPTIAVLTYLSQEQEIYLEPGDDLEINFGTPDFLAGKLTFDGKGSAHNKFLRDFQRAFESWDEAHLLFEITERKPLNYQAMMNVYRQDKWRFYKNYARKDKDKFSPDFVYYLSAEIDYWWGYYLLRYRIEKPITTGEAIPMQLPNTYYNFLSELLITNDRALNNQHYSRFTEDYLDFRNEALASGISPDFNAEIFRVNVPSTILLKGPEEQPILREVKMGVRLKYLGEQSDFTSKMLIREALHEDYWYKVKTHDGIIGWVNGIGLKKESDNLPPSPLPEKNIPYTPKHKNADLFLHGKTRQHKIASDIYWRANLEDAGVLKKEVEAFLLDNTYKDYDQIIKHTYDRIREERGLDTRTIYGAVVYRVINAPDVARATTEVVHSPLANIPLDPILGKTLNRMIPTDDPLVQLVLEQGLKAQVLRQQLEKEKNTTRPMPVLNTAATEYVRIDPTLVELPTSPVPVMGVVGGALTRPLELILYSDPILLEEEKNTIRIGSNKRFTLDLKLSEAKMGMLVYGHEQVPIYLEPGDELNINFTGTNFLKTLFYRGKGANHNNYLKDRVEQFRKLEGNLQDRIKNSSPFQFMAYMEEVKKEKNLYLETYHHAHPFSRNFLAYAQGDIDYWYGYQLLNYPWENPLYHNQEGPLAVPEGYYDFIGQIDAVNEDALVSHNYLYYLDLLISHHKEQPQNGGMDRYQLADKYLTGKPLAYFRAKQLSSDCRSGRAKQSGTAIKKFIDNNEFDEYNNVLRTVYNDAKGLLRNEPAPDFALRDINGRTVTLADLSGKVVYLDFWATWCPPCVYSLKNSKEWKKAFSPDEVAFVYVSLDKDQRAWRNFIKQQNIKGTHLIVEGGDPYKSPIAKGYKVKRLPAIFIIDREGKVYYNSSSKESATGSPSDMVRGLLGEQ